jgi:hypothetical protein
MPTIQTLREIYADRLKGTYRARDTHQAYRPTDTHQAYIARHTPSIHS